MNERYFQSYVNYFWCWEDNARVVAIPKGSTIAYTEMLQQNLSSLAEQGLPRFGSFLLVIIALNPQAKNLLSEAEQVFHSFSANKYYAETEIPEAFRFLRTLAEVPERYKSGPNKNLLLKAIFEGSHGALSLKDSQRVLHSSEILPQNQLLFEFNDEIVHKDLKTLCLLGRKMPSPEKILEKIAHLPLVEEEILPEQESGNNSDDFIEQLLTDQRTFNIAALIPSLWSGFNLPFHSSAVSQQTSGGVADLSNKGNVDQLLISEYANEDVVFLSRLANNEALYLSREAPPVRNELKRVLLIDISIKTWGTPKTLAFAGALAIARHPKTDIPCELFAIGTDYHALVMDSIDGVIDAIQQVDVSIDSSKGLANYFRDNPHDKKREVFILTEKTAVERADMQRTMSEFAEKINYWVYSDSQGYIDLFRNFKNSKKHIQHLELDLHRLWTQKAKHLPVLVKKDSGGYPILFRPYYENAIFMSTANGEIFQVSKEKVLFRFYRKTARNHEVGWELLHENLPSSITDYQIGLLKNGEYILLCLNKQMNEFMLLNLTTKAEIKSHFSDWKQVIGPTFVFYEDCFFHRNSRGCWCIDCDGKVSPIQENYKNLYAEFNKREKELQTNFGYSSPVFKNVKTVGINRHGRLMFNIHELVLNAGHHIKLNPTAKNQESLLITAAEINHNLFEFEDGSTIEINRSGLFILSSSNLEIPKIYIPSALDASLGVSTADFFAGNHVYYREPLFEMTLLPNAGDRLQQTKLIANATNCGLKAAKTYVDNTPTTIAHYFNEKEISELTAQLEDCGTVVETKAKDSGFEQLEKISTSLFFEQFITPFIHTIRAAYGTQN
ncbi:MAG: hypothetical protein K0R65_1727 [Crocinitomicaceae bacterium]|jgi:ribosomal protein L7/L12|nr:hypothetical protein [Crocinitomicaceae bacterium]